MSKTVTLTATSPEGAGKTTLLTLFSTFLSQFGIEPVLETRGREETMTVDLAAGDLTRLRIQTDILRDEPDALKVA